MPHVSAAARREYQAQWARRRRDDWIASRGGVCEKCGSSDRLEVDHIDPKTKLMNPREVWNRRDEVRLAELAKCQVLCHECHKAKSLAERPRADHGNTYYVRYRCRCDICRADHAAQSRAWRARRASRT